MAFGSVRHGSVQIRDELKSEIQHHYSHPHFPETTIPAGPPASQDWHEHRMKLWLRSRFNWSRSFGVKEAAMVPLTKQSGRL